MANRLITPRLNPLHGIQVFPVVDITQYESKHWDDNMFFDTIKPYDQHVRFWQKWRTDDTIKLQYTSNYSPITLKVFRCDGSEVYSIDFSIMQQDADNPGFYIRQVELGLSIFPLGQYYAEVQAGSGPDVIIRFEPFIISDSLPETLLIEYSHFEKKGEIWFQSPVVLNLRIPGVIKYDETKSIDTIYPDQDENEELLHSTPYRVSKLSIGGAIGIPPWLKDILSRIFGCSDVKIDGRYYTKEADAAWERNEVEHYPLKGWSLMLRDKFNRDSQIIDNDAVLKGIAAAGLLVGVKGFGMDDGDSGDTYIPIEQLV